MLSTLFIAWFMPTHHEPIPPKPTYSHIMQAPQTPEAQLETDTAPLKPVQIVTRVRTHGKTRGRDHHPYRVHNGVRHYPDYWWKHK